MKDRAKLQCNHSQYSVEMAEKDQYNYYYELVIFDMFPEFQPGICTEKCIEKMKKIIDLTLFRYANQAKDYFDDCKIHINRNHDPPPVTTPTPSPNDWDLENGFDIKSIPPDWRKIFKTAGIKKSELKNAETAQFIANIIREYMVNGGVVPQQSLQPGRSAPTPHPSHKPNVTRGTPPPASVSAPTTTTSNAPPGLSTRVIGVSQERRS